MEYITDYSARTAALTAYLQYLSRAEHNLRDRPTPEVPLEDKPKASAAEVRRRLLNQI